jgi:hypothetical protein
VKLIGLGGVGGIVARYLAVFLSTLEAAIRLVLVDGDEFEPKNASRMLFSEDGNKAAVVRDDLLDALPESSLTLVAVEEYVTEENLPRLLHEGDLVILAVDNHATRKLVSDHCRDHLDDVCLISGGNDGVGEDSTGRVLRGTYGNVQVHLREGGVEVTPRLCLFHPEILEPADRLPTDLSCTELLESVPQILFANLTAAACILNAVWLHLTGTLAYAELAFDIAAGRMAPVPLPSCPGAPVSPPGRGPAHPEKTGAGA